MYDHLGGVVSTRFDIYQQLALFSHIIAVLNFGNLECLWYNSMVSFTKHVSPPLSKDIHTYCLIKNLPTQCSSSTDPVLSTSNSLIQLSDSEGLSSSNYLKSVASDGFYSEEHLNEDRSSSSTTPIQDKESPPPLLQCIPLRCPVPPFSALYPKFPRN